MKGEVVVANDLADVPAMLAARAPAVVREWKVDDFADVTVKHDVDTAARGLKAFMKAQCTQCHQVFGHGVNLGPDLCDVFERYKGEKLLRQILEPSHEINDKYLSQRLVMNDDRVITGVVVKEEKGEYHVLTNLLTPTSVTRIPVKDVVQKTPSKLSPMPTGLANVLTREEVIDLLGFLEVGYKMPPHPKGKPPAPGR